MAVGGEPERIEAELTDVLASSRAALCRYVHYAFPRLAGQAEDIVQEAVLETLRRVRREAFRPKTGWPAWLRVVVRSRAIDRLRSWERRVFRQMASGVARDGADPGGRPSSDDGGPTDARPGPRTGLVEAERRGRQGLLLSQVLEEFCRWCEARPERAALKETYERSLRGQQPAEIAVAMGLPAARVYDYLNRARQWVFDRIRQADVDRSIFLTLHRRKRE